MEDLEKEIQARLEFKMNELLTAIENTAIANWGAAFLSGSQKHSHYWEAFEQMKQMLIKEMGMSTPFDDMANQRKREKRNTAIEKIMNRFCKLGEKDFDYKQKSLVPIIEDCQNW